MSQNLKTRVEEDGEYPCPKCPDEGPFESMDAWVTHVSKHHDPYGEFVARWG